MKKSTILIITIVAIIGIAAILFLTLKPTTKTAVDQVASVNLSQDITTHPLSGVVTLTPTLSGNKSVQKVELVVDSAVTHVSYAAPYSLNLDTSELSNGKHTVMIRVTYSDATTSESKTFSIVVDNGTASTTPSTTTTDTAQESVTTSSQARVTSSYSSPQAPNDTVSPPATGDTQKPSTVTGISLSATNQTTVHITWSAATDNVGVTSYTVLRNGVEIATVSTLTYDDTVVVPGNDYSYTIVANDAAGNHSTVSAKSSITLPLATALHGTPTPAENSNENTALSLGMRFTPKVDGTITGLRFYKFAQNTGTHYGSLWTSNGLGMATITFSNESADGWQTATFNMPVRVTAGASYVVTYHTDSGYYAATPYAFSDPQPSDPYIEPLQSVSGTPNGLFGYTGDPNAFPQNSYHDTNYWVDPLFKPDDLTNNATTDNLARIPWEGGPSYYQQFSTAAGKLTDPSFFPVGVWYESVTDPSDVTKDQSFGINTYVQLTSTSNLSYVNSAGSYAITADGVPKGPETVGWMNADEADMNFGPGNAAWDEPNFKCTVDGTQCGYTAMATLIGSHSDSSRFDYANYGKGVMMWEQWNDAAQFVNNYTQVVSDDMYFYTDPAICGEAATYLGIQTNQCRLAANYGAVIDKMRALDAVDGKRQPIWAFVEDGHPSSGTAPTITADQVAGAVFSSLIHGARGIIYFNHNFGGSCISQHSLRDNCFPDTTATVTQIDQEIKSLAPVLNTQSYDYLSNSHLDTMLKEYNGSYYLFATPSRGATPGSFTLRLPANAQPSSVEVFNESRTLPVTNGTITDTFANEDSYHIYKITP